MKLIKLTMVTSLFLAMAVQSAFAEESNLGKQAADSISMANVLCAETKVKPEVSTAYVVPSATKAAEKELPGFVSTGL